MDMAVGVIVGGAFTAIVTSLNQDILTPILAIFGGTDFSNLYVKLGSGDTAPVLMYGNFITAVCQLLPKTQLNIGSHVLIVKIQLPV